MLRSQPQMAPFAQEEDLSAALDEYRESEAAVEQELARAGPEPSPELLQARAAAGCGPPMAVAYPHIFFF